MCNEEKYVGQLGRYADVDDEDYKQRFIQEYNELKGRYDRLARMTVKYHAGTLDFKPDCPISLLEEQQSLMGNYLRVLKIRAEIEHIKLEC